jgi:hypothetical protein
MMEIATMTSMIMMRTRISNRDYGFKPVSESKAVWHSNE